MDVKLIDVRVILSFFALGVLVFVCFPVVATGLPLDGPLKSIANSFTGKTATAIVSIALFVSGGLLVFGGELSDFARRITWMTLAVSLMVAQKSFLNLFGSKVSLTALLF